MNKYASSLTSYLLYHVFVLYGIRIIDIYHKRWENMNKRKSCLRGKADFTLCLPFEYNVTFSWDGQSDEKNSNITTFTEKKRLEI